MGLASAIKRLRDTLELFAEENISEYPDDELIDYAEQRISQLELDKSLFEIAIAYGIGPELIDRWYSSAIAKLSTVGDGEELRSDQLLALLQDIDTEERPDTFLAFFELSSNGYQPTSHNRLGLIHRISRDQGGNWFYCHAHGFNEEASRDYLKVNQMPYLKKLVLDLETRDSDFVREGGRVYVSTTLFSRATKV